MNTWYVWIDSCFTGNHIKYPSFYIKQFNRRVTTISLLRNDVIVKVANQCYWLCMIFFDEFDVWSTAIWLNVLHDNTTELTKMIAFCCVLLVYKNMTAIIMQMFYMNLILFYAFEAKTISPQCCFKIRYWKRTVTVQTPFSIIYQCFFNSDKR